MKKTYLHFRFFSPNDIIFVREEDLQDVILGLMGDGDISYICENEDGDLLPDNECGIYDSKGNAILTGDGVNAKAGTITVDGCTHIVVELNDKEI